jgi:dTDP-4-dehydrorhamnose 3,5-epimerase
MIVSPTFIAGVLVLESETYADARGFFRERFRDTRYAALAEEWSAPGLGGPFVQENHSRSHRDVLRGLHFQRRRPQGKLVECVRGTVFDVVADIRTGSPTFGRWFGVELDDETGRQLWVPPGLAHGFCVLSEVADVVYRCTEPYAPDDEGGVAWDDPQLGIDWPITVPMLSDKDRRLPYLAGPGEQTPATAPDLVAGRLARS